MLSHTYGVYRSSLYGRVLLVDPLMPPRKCPLDCVVCPLGRPQRLTGESRLQGPPAAKIFKDLEENMPKGLDPDSLMIWGFGDPLLLNNIVETLKELTHLMREIGLDARILIHTSLLQGGLLEGVSSVVDSLLIPYLWYGDDKQVLGWPPSKQFSAYIELLKHYNKLHEGLVKVELYVFRLGSTHYPSADQLDEALLYITRAGIENIVVKPLDRPPSSYTAKPPIQSYVDMVVEKLTESGIKSAVESSLQFDEPLEWNKVAARLFNQLLRMPLTYDEIRSIYGELGVLALSNMVSRGKVTLIHWGGKLFYRATI